MGSDELLPLKKIKVSIRRGDEEQDDDSVFLVFSEMNDLEVELSNSNTEDIKKLFDAVFEYISTNKTMIEFELEDEETDIFNQVSEDILDQLNAEIKDSEEDFVNIWQLVKDDEE